MGVGVNVTIRGLGVVRTRVIEGVSGFDDAWSCWHYRRVGGMKFVGLGMVCPCQKCRVRSKIQ